MDSCRDTAECMPVGCCTLRYLDPRLVFNATPAAAGAFDQYYWLARAKHVNDRLLFSSAINSKPHRC